MNAERFRTLAEAWGGAIARWPAAEQDEAFAFLAREASVADAILAEARALDETLDEAERLSPSLALRDSILASAPRPRAARSPFLRWLTGAGVGAGLAAATAAGLLAGVNLTVAQSGATVSDDEAMLASIYDSDAIGDEAGDVS